MTCQLCPSNSLKVLFKLTLKCPSQRNQMWDSPPSLFCLFVLFWFSNWVTYLCCGDVEDGTTLATHCVYLLCSQLATLYNMDVIIKCCAPACTVVEKLYCKFTDKWKNTNKFASVMVTCHRSPLLGKEKKYKAEKAAIKQHLNEAKGQTSVNMAWLFSNGYNWAYLATFLLDR